MSTLQVKNLPEDLHAELVSRARAEHVTLSEFVTRTLRKELARPSLNSWVSSIRDRGTTPRAIDSVAAVEAVRAEPEQRHSRR